MLTTTEKYFLEYYKTGNFNSLLPYLFSHAEHIESETLNKIYLKINTCYHEKILYSSGSSGEISSYIFGPKNIIGQVEHFNKLQNQNFFVIKILNNIFYNQKGPYFEFKIKEGFLQNAIVSFSVLNIQIIKKIINEIENLGTTQKICLFGSPHFFLYANSFEFFQDFLVKRKVMLISTDYLSFYKKEILLNKRIQINDCMINWKTGVNFFRCKYNSNHVIPIYLKVSENCIFNLLNLYKNDSNILCNDDFFNIEVKNQVCQCGLNKCVVDFIPHKNISFYRNGFLELADKLNSHFLNLQFVKKSNFVIDCLYIVDGLFHNEDRFLIQNFFFEYEINFLKNKYIFTGKNKLDFFYVNVNEKEYCSIDLKNHIKII